MSDDLDALIERLNDTRSDLLAALDGLPEEARDLERWDGEWTAKDVICHIAAWEDACAAALEELARGAEARALPEHLERTFEGRAAELHRDDPWDEAVEYFDESRQRLVSALIELYALPLDSYAEGTPARALADQSVHESEHTKAIEAWRKERGL